MGARELALLLRQRTVSAVEVTQAHIEQIIRLNPALNAIVTPTFDQAMKRARELDATGVHQGALHGIPVVHKDLFDTRGVRTTYGSRIYENHVPDSDAPIVELMEAAGAISLGKTNTPEFGAGSQTFNAVFGATRNPHDLSKTCGGSSGGSAVALACGMAALANGTDLGGSLRNPASFCGVVGMRPSAGLVPKRRSRASAFDLDVDGPMARTVDDLTLLLSVIADPGSSVTSSHSNRKVVRVGWYQGLESMPFEHEVTRVFETSQKTFVDMGCIVEAAQPDFQDADESFRTLRAWYAALNHAEHLTQYSGMMKETLAREVERGMSLSAAHVAVAETQQAELLRRTSQFFERFDVFVLPTVQVLPFPVEQPYPTEINGRKLDSYIDWMRSCYFISATGHPAISVPAGFSNSGLPVGIQMVGPHNGEKRLLEIALAFEQAACVKHVRF